MFIEHNFMTFWIFIGVVYLAVAFTVFLAIQAYRFYKEVRPYD